MNPSAPQRRSAWRVLLDDRLLAVLLAAAGPAGLLLMFVYTSLAWRDYGLRLGDFDLSITEVAPPAIAIAALLALGVLAAGPVVKQRPRTPVRRQLAAVAVFAAPAFGAAAVGSAIGGYADIVGTQIMASTMAGAWTRLAVTWVFQRKWRLSRRRRVTVVVVVAVVPSLFLLAIGFAVGSSSTTFAPAPSLLPFGFGPAVRTVRVVTHDDALAAEFADVSCVASLGQGPSGRVLRVVRDTDGNPKTVGVASIVLVDPQLVTLVSGPPCSEVDRALMWRPGAARKRLAELRAQQASTTTTTPAAATSTTSTIAVTTTAAP